MNILRILLVISIVVSFLGCENKKEPSEVKPAPQEEIEAEIVPVQEAPPAPEAAPLPKEEKKEELPKPVVKKKKRKTPAQKLAACKRKWTRTCCKNRYAEFGSNRLNTRCVSPISGVVDKFKLRECQQAVHRYKCKKEFWAVMNEN